MFSPASLLKDPPPTHAFELSEEGIAFARVTEPGQLNFLTLQPGTLIVSPGQDNVQQPDTLQAEIEKIAPPNGHRKRRAAIILPDY